MKPDEDQIKRASKDVAWEYDTMLAASLEMTNAHGSPINDLAQEAFLAHVRNLAEFFREGIEGFKKKKALPRQHLRRRLLSFGRLEIRKLRQG